MFILAYIYYLYITDEKTDVIKMFSAHVSHGHVHQKSTTTSRDAKRLAYINADVLVHEYGLVNHTRRQ